MTEKSSSTVRTLQVAESTPARPACPDLRRLSDVPVDLTVEIGRTRMTVGETLELRQGSIVTLNRMAGEPVDLLVNGTPIARGEVVVIDEQFGVRITDVSGGSAQALRHAAGAAAPPRPLTPARRLPCVGPAEPQLPSRRPRLKLPSSTPKPSNGYGTAPYRLARPLTRQEGSHVGRNHARQLVVFTLGCRAVRAADRAGPRDHPLRRAALGRLADRLGPRRDQPPRPDRPRLRPGRAPRASTRS